MLMPAHHPRDSKLTGRECAWTLEFLPTLHGSNVQPSCVCPSTHLPDFRGTITKPSFQVVRRVQGGNSRTPPPQHTTGTQWSLCLPPSRFPPPFPTSHFSSGLKRTFLLLPAVRRFEIGPEKGLQILMRYFYPELIPAALLFCNVIARTSCVHTPRPPLRPPVHLFLLKGQLGRKEFREISFLVLVLESWLIYRIYEISDV